MAPEQSGGEAPRAQHFGLPVVPPKMYLLIRSGIDTGRHVALESKIARLGRSPDHADIVLRRDPRISRRHATIIRLPHPRGAHFVVIDEGSKNGVLVNERRVEVHCLSPCDSVQIGETVLEFVPEELLPPSETDLVSLEKLSVGEAH